MKIFLYILKKKKHIFSILHTYFYKTLTSVCLLYILFYLNNIFLIFLLLFHTYPWPTNFNTHAEHFLFLFLILLLSFSSFSFFSSFFFFFFIILSIHISLSLRAYASVDEIFFCIFGKKKLFFFYFTYLFL